MSQDELMQKSATSLAKQNNHKSHYIEELYEKWFLDYASYVILDRAIPSCEDGLKPVQRRLFFAMEELDDGRYNKAANIIGQTMRYHPHGDAAIFEALVKLAQKGHCIDTQGNWGNPLTGDKAAAARYVEARLTPFAKDILFSNDYTEWELSYDSRSKEPKSLPTKFPLLLLLGAEGIAVGLATKILPHNFCEILRESIAFLKGYRIQIFPDFPTGGEADFSNYDNGRRGGKTIVRAKIEEIENHKLAITELPFGTTTDGLISSIVSAQEKGKLRIKKIDDNTADCVEIIISVDKEIDLLSTIDSLYLYTDCEVSLSVNCCVIKSGRPCFLDIPALLEYSVVKIKDRLGKEIQGAIQKTKDKIHSLTLEKLFVEEKIYRYVEQANEWKKLKSVLKKAFLEYEHKLIRKVSDDDIEKLLDIKIKKLSKYDQKKSQNNLDQYVLSLKKHEFDLENLVAYTISFFQALLKKYGKAYTRRTTIASFMPQSKSKLVLPQCSYFFNREKGLVGYGVKEGVSLGDYQEGSLFLVMKQDGFFRLILGEKSVYVGENVLGVYACDQEKGSEIHVLWQVRKSGAVWAKRCCLSGLSMGRDYFLTKTREDVDVLYMSVVEGNQLDEIVITSKDPLGFMDKRKIVFSEYELKKQAAKGVLLSDKASEIKVKKVFQTKKTGKQRYWFDRQEGTVNTDQTGVYLGKLEPSNHLVFLSTCGKVTVTPFSNECRGLKRILAVKKLSLPRMPLYLIYSQNQTFFLVFYRLTSEWKARTVCSTKERHKIHFFSFDQQPKVILTGLETLTKKRTNWQVDLRDLCAKQGDSDFAMPLDRYGVIERVSDMGLE